MSDNNQRAAVVAIKNSKDEGWMGVVQPGMNIPTEFGPILWQHLQDNFNSLDRFARMLLDSNSWMDYINDGLCRYCGKVGVGHPVQIRGDIYDKAENPDPHWKDAFPDIEAKHHNHVVNKPKVLSTDAAINGLWMEWVYLVDPKTYSLSILKAVQSEGTHEVTIMGIPYRQSNYRYYQMENFSLFNGEPVWDAIREQGAKVSEYYFKKQEKSRG